jgi:uroporphyrin-3 C-methyltransferase
MTPFWMSREKISMPETATQEPPGRSPGPGRRSRRPGAVTIAFAIVALLLAWLWFDGRSELSGLREQVAQRLRDSESESRDARLLAKQAQDALREVQAKLSLLEVRVAESQSQQVALEALYQELSRSRDEWVLAEIEQILTIASQQLQLAGNVRAALVALQTADARLARSDRPQFAPLRKVLANDIERLKAAPSLDIPGLAIKLDQLIATADSLPLAQEARPPARADEDGGAKNDAGGIWARLSTDFINELRQLVRVQNMERPDPAILSPSQAFFLRENLKLRLLNARLALLARDEATFRGDLKTAGAWLNRYFDPRARATVSAQQSLAQLGSSGTSMALPTIGESLAAVRSYKVARDRPPR